ncbi:hypothetical protein MUK70_11850 [Dyadobacter chenwenxiniae]|uniref:Uncharacterized protein n=1 Tax=Dyadobacter chenwenxiniae TaxID=2906456 RepID=A0A9X1TD50_9BACT|nr:hypothetical protein [Dyadobacter chenwenxiniae]MCF0059935.1 hypothetical protein [Dyadobacter chenwenxiniae]UON85674.1 hypothetical protein MUK70_11850 [Dyadobacter chenwenxiniae]
MNKLLGYFELKIEEDVIPIKIGCYTLEKFCESFGLGLSQIGDVFERKLVGEKEIEIPKEPVKFLATILFHGSNYCAKLSGSGNEYSIEQAYEWVDEIGFNSDQSVKVLTSFYAAIMNGGTPIKEVPEGKSKKKAPDMADLQG